MFQQHHTKLGLPVALTITICGGGNGAHTAAAYLGSKPGFAVNVLTRQPTKWAKQLVMTTANTSWESKGDIHGLLNIVTDDASKVIPQSDIVIVAAPAQAHPPILKQIAPHLTAGSVLGSLFCQGGFDWAARAALGDKWDQLDGVWGLLNIPWLCTTAEYGHKVRLVGPKKFLQLTCSPLHKAKDFARLVSTFFDMPCSTVPNFLSLTLTPSNQIIHPARYYGMFKDWDGQSTFSKEQIQWGLYSEFDQTAADWLQKLDDELQSVKKGLVARYPNLDLSSVLPIGERICQQYGDDVTDKSSLLSIFRTNRGYAATRTPMLAQGSGFIPNINSRLFWEDMPFGLCILKSMAQMMDIKTPTIDMMIFWHQKFMQKVYLLPDGTLNKELIPETAAPEAYGFHSLDALVADSLPKHKFEARM